MANGGTERSTPGRTPGSTPGGGWVPIPDPTALTTEAVGRATDQFQRELANLRDVLETRMTGTDRDRELLWTEFHNWPVQLETILDARRREFTGDLDGVQRLVEQRLAAMDKAIALAAADLDRYVTVLRQERDRASGAEREYITAQIEILATASRERYAAIQEQFAASEKAVDAAFAAAKEAVAEQNRANGQAIAKSEGAVKEQLASLGQVSDTRFAAQEDKITDARDRITVIESLTRGIEQAGGRTREEKQLEHGERGLQNSGTMIALFSVSLLISAIAIIVTLLHHLDLAASGPARCANTGRGLSRQPE